MSLRLYSTAACSNDGDYVKLSAFEVLSDHLIVREQFGNGASARKKGAPLAAGLVLPVGYTE